eukprot:8795333-Pyramimonas_sp.AAC.1
MKPFARSPTRPSVRSPTQPSLKGRIRPSVRSTIKVLVRNPPAKAFSKELKMPCWEIVEEASDGFSPRNGSRATVKLETVSVRVSESPRTGPSDSGR